LKDERTETRETPFTGSDRLDRGTEPERDHAEFPWFDKNGERVNDVHLTIAEKQAAPSAADENRAKRG